MWIAFGIRNKNARFVWIHTLCTARVAPQFHEITRVSLRILLQYVSPGCVRTSFRILIVLLVVLRVSTPHLTFLHAISSVTGSRFLSKRCPGDSLFSPLLDVYSIVPEIFENHRQN